VPLRSPLHEDIVALSASRLSEGGVDVMGHGEKRAIKLTCKLPGLTHRTFLGSGKYHNHGYCNYHGLYIVRGYYHAVIP